MPRLPRRGSGRDRRSHHAKPETKIFTTVQAAGERREIPALPKGRWSERTLDWWRTLWSAPWATEYTEPDRIALGRLAELVEAYHDPEATPRDKVALSVEVRLMGSAFGLDAASRRRLGWDVQPQPDVENHVQRLLREGTKAPDPRDVLDHY